jgi:hypothetical protein
MGTIQIPPKAILFTGLIYNPVEPREHIHGILEKEYGKIRLTSPTVPFDETHYYHKEMGDCLQREFVAFDVLIEMQDIVHVKLRTNSIEDHYFSIGNKRCVNIDPGYLTSAKVVLATTKNFQHRVYLGMGIYAEVTLRYRKNSFMPWEWTYPDYRSDVAIAFFNRLRELYRCKIKGIA